MVEDLELGYYRHKKTGKVYVANKIVINATNAQNEQKMVLYSLYGHTELVFVRELSKFLSKFEKM